MQIWSNQSDKQHCFPTEEKTGRFHEGSLNARNDATFEHA